MVEGIVAETPIEQRRAFHKWRRQLRDHHEFADLEKLLSKILSRATNRREIKWNIFWNAWRAATWTPAPPQEATERMLAAARLMLTDGTANQLRQIAADIDRAGRLGNKFATTAGVDARQLCDWADTLSKGGAAVQKALSGDMFLHPMLHGPFFYPRKNGATRLPGRPALLAAQIAILCKHWGVKINWAMLSKLIAVAGIQQQIAAESLQVSARKLISDDKAGKVRLIGWPQDIPQLTLREFRTHVQLRSLISGNRQA